MADPEVPFSYLSARVLKNLAISLFYDLLSRLFVSFLSILRRPSWSKIGQTLSMIDQYSLVLSSGSACMNVVAEGRSLMNQTST